MQANGGKCVFSSEYNYHAQRAYELNFGEVPFGDITKFDLEKIPHHDFFARCPRRRFKRLRCTPERQVRPLSLAVTGILEIFTRNPNEHS